MISRNENSSEPSSWRHRGFTFQGPVPGQGHQRGRLRGHRVDSTPRGYGLYDMAGNIWQYAAVVSPDYFKQLANALSVVRNPQGAKIPFDPSSQACKNACRKAARSCVLTSEVLECVAAFKPANINAGLSAAKARGVKLGRTLVTGFRRAFLLALRHKAFSQIFRERECSHGRPDSRALGPCEDQNRRTIAAGRKASWQDRASISNTCICW